MKRERKIVFLAAGVILIAMIGGGALGFAISRSGVFGKEVEFRDLEFEVDREVIMKDDMVNMTVTNVPDDANVTWMMEDGGVFFGKTCCHMFDIAKTNHIEVVARWDHGRGNGTLDLCCLVEDFYDERSGDAIRDLRRGWGRGSSIDAPFYYCEMGGPEIHPTVTLHEAIGSIEIWIFAYGETFHYSESHPYLATYETINFDMVYDNLDIPEGPEELWFEVDFIVWDGRVGSYDFTISVDYPQPEESE